VRQSIGSKCLIFFVRLGRRGNLFADLNRVVMERSRGLGKRLKRQDEGSWIDLENLHACLCLCAYANDGSVRI